MHLCRHTYMDIHIYIYICHCASGTQVRVVWTPSPRWISTLRLEILSEIPNFFMDLDPPTGNPSGNPASSVRESDRFGRELTESQFSQRTRYHGNPENATSLTRGPVFLIQMSLNACQGTTSPSKGPSPWDPLQALKIQRKSNRNSAA